MSNDDKNTNVIDIRARLEASKSRAIAANHHELIEGFVAIGQTIEKLELAVHELGKDRFLDPELLMLIAQKIMELLEGFDPILDAIEGATEGAKLPP